jgi:hypothetical protein
MARDPAFAPLVEAVFGCRAFERGASASYVALRGLIERVSSSSVGWEREAYESTAPPPPPSTP